MATRPDIISVVLGAHSFANLLERADFLRRIQRADQQILIAVRTARRDAARRDEAPRQGRGPPARGRRRAAHAPQRAREHDRRPSPRGARRSCACAPRAPPRSPATRGNRRRLQSRLRAAEAAIARAASAGGRASGGPWAIPWEVVQCESGGQNFPPNSAGASGYYQILPETWKRHGGKGPAAHLALEGRAGPRRGDASGRTTGPTPGSATGSSRSRACRAPAGTRGPDSGRRRERLTLGDAAGGR